MSSRGVFGSYYPVYSTIHSQNSIIKIINFIIFILLSCFTSSLTLSTMLLLYIIFMIVCSKVPIKYYINMIFKLRYIFILLAFLLAFLNMSFESVSIIFIKIISSICYVSILTFTTSTSELNYGIEKVLNVFNIFNLRISNIVSFITSLLQFYPLLCGCMNSILMSSQGRGVDYTHAGIIGRSKALSSSFLRAIPLTIRKYKERKDYMKLMNYSTKKYRTNIKVQRVNIFDIICLLMNISIVVLYIYETGIL